MQLALDIEVPQDHNFDSFCWQGNEVLRQQLTHSLDGHGERLFYLWGAKGAGKTHLLHAANFAMGQKQAPSVLLPLDKMRAHGPAPLEGIESLGLICLDNINAIAGLPEWEEAIFHLYNRVRDQGHGLLFISGDSSPTSLKINLPDLRSRLAWGMVFQVNELDEATKVQVLQQLAKQQGLSLPDSAAQFLISRCSRNMHDLVTLLEQLDTASLQAQRKLTVPFIKQALSL